MTNHADLIKSMKRSRYIRLCRWMAARWPGDPVQVGHHPGSAAYIERLAARRYLDISTDPICWCAGPASREYARQYPNRPVSRILRGRGL